MNQRQFSHFKKLVIMERPNAPWFKQGFDRVKAEQYLMQFPEGSLEAFVVRDR
jgi:hypothetical protein